MSDIVKLIIPKQYSENNYINIYDSFEDSEKAGKKLYKQNQNYRSIANLMENTEFRNFYNNFQTGMT